MVRGDEESEDRKRCLSLGRDLMDFKFQPKTISRFRILSSLQVGYNGCVALALQAYVL